MFATKNCKGLETSINRQYIGNMYHVWEKLAKFSRLRELMSGSRLAKSILNELQLDIKHWAVKQSSAVRLCLQSPSILSVHHRHTNIIKSVSVLSFFSFCFQPALYFSPLTSQRSRQQTSFRGTSAQFRTRLPPNDARWLKDSFNGKRQHLRESSQSTSKTRPQSASCSGLIESFFGDASWKFTVPLVRERCVGESVQVMAEQIGWWKRGCVASADERVTMGRLAERGE